MYHKYILKTLSTFIDFRLVGLKMKTKCTEGVILFIINWDLYQFIVHQHRIHISLLES